MTPTYPSGQLNEQPLLISTLLKNQLVQLLKRLSTRFRKGKRLLSEWIFRKEIATIMKAFVLFFNPHLKIEEAMIYLSTGRAGIATKCEEYVIVKNRGGYCEKEDIDSIFARGPCQI